MSGLALNVRQQLGRDFRGTLARHATPAVQEEFAQLSATLWTLYAPETGWSQFADLSLPIVARADESNPVIAYYHPWSDTVLVTLWEISDDRVQLINLEMLPGSLLRDPERDTPDPTPRWLALEMHPVDALAESIRASALALWKHSEPGNNVWRRLFLPPGDASLAALNQAVVEHNLGMNLASIDNFWFAEAAESETIVAVRSVVTDAMTAVFGEDESGFAPILAQADESDAYVNRIFEHVPLDYFADLEVVYYLPAKDEVLVFMASAGKAHVAVCFTLRRDRKDWQLVKIDAIPYAMMLHTGPAAELE